MKNIGIGCGFYVLLAIVTSLILPTNNAGGTIGLAFFCSIPLFIATYFVEKCARYKWVIWSAGWALCIALSFVIPYDKTDKAGKPGEAKKTEKTAAMILITSAGAPFQTRVFDSRSYLRMTASRSISRAFG